MKRTSRLTTAVAVALAAAGLHAGSFTSDFSNPAQTGLTLIGGARANGDPYPAIANGVLAIAEEAWNNGGSRTATTAANLHFAGETTGSDQIILSPDSIP